jgi:hypothetical protein
MFFPENESMTTLMQLELEHYFQGRQNIDIYINKFKDLMDMSRYMDPITIVLKFCRGLNAMTQDRIAKLGMDRPCDSDIDGWLKAACQLDLNCLANEVFHYTL